VGVSAIDRTGGSIIASNIPSPVWESWKGSSVEHGLRMECCGAIAVAKTSPNGVQFFAHISNECATAPETVWHIGAKALVVDGMRRLGATCSEEVFEDGARPWKADVLVQWAGRRIAIEIQRSYVRLGGSGSWGGHRHSDRRSRWLAAVSGERRASFGWGSLATAPSVHVAVGSAPYAVCREGEMRATISACAV